MYENLKNNNLHAEQQYRFCKLHSIDYAAVKLTDYSSKQMKSGKIVKYCHLPVNVTTCSNISFVTFIFLTYVTYFVT